MRFKRFVSAVLALVLVLSLIPGQLFAPADAADPVYGTYAEAVEDLRAGLVQRKSSVTVYLKYGGAPVGSFPAQLIDAAREHTGVPNEGDYIARAMSGCTYDVDYYVEGGTYYVTATYTPDWLTTAEQEAEVDAAVDALLEELDLWGKGEYEIITGVYDWVTENVSYDYDNYDDNANSLKHTVYAALLNRCCLCQGFSTLLYRLLLELGVDCRVISGTADGEGHAWNIVKLEDVYYNCDPTWDRSLKGHYRYFLCSEANFPDHTRSSKYTTAKFTAAYPMADTSYVIKVNASGTVTNSITWELDEETGCLCVTGTGVIPSYRHSSPPWDEYVDNVRSIVISEGITEVGERAFAWCKNATSVTLPSTLKVIREYGFNNLRSLQYVTLPEGLTTLESSAFSECAALREIILPDSVTTVGSSAFSNCQNLRRAELSAGMTHIPNSMFFNDTSLAEVVIPDSVTSIGDTAFRCCNGLKTFTIPAHMTSLGVAAISDCTGMTHIYVDEGNPTYTDIDGVLYSADEKTLITFPAGRATTYTVPDGTEIIGRSAFCRNVKLRTVYFPDSVRRIENYAFAWCEYLQSVTLGVNIDYVGDNAFYYCRRMTSVTFENPDVVLDGCFGECDSLVSVELPAGMRAIPGYLFYGCAYLAAIEFPAGVTSIGSSAFLDCDSLTRVTIPGHIKTVGRQAFDYCTRLRTVTIESGVTRLEDYSFRNSPNLTKVVIPSSVTYIGKECFYECPNVTLWCEYGSAAYRYAVQHGIPYVDTHTHSYEYVSVVPPTCVEQGYTFHYCSCGDGYATDYVDVTDHSMGAWWEDYPPTCTDTGEEYRYCSYCAYYETREIPAAGHSYMATEIYPPTCTEQGYSVLNCAVCWDERTGDYVPAAGHSYENGTCTVCGAEDPNAVGFLSLRYDDHWDVSGKTVEIVDAGTPTSYQVGYGVEENAVPDTAVVALKGNYLVAAGIGTAKVRIDGQLHKVTVTAAPISLLLILGQSNAEGMEGVANQSIACENGQVYSTYAKANGLTGDAGLTAENAGNYVPSALSGVYSTVNVNGTDTKLSQYPVNSLTEAGSGKYGMDSGIAYEWTRQTGEKVWVVNAAHGASNITSWQEGAANFEEAKALVTACADVLQKEIRAGHYTFSHMGYYWSQGCANETGTAEYYANQYIAMHEAFKRVLAFDFDSNADTEDSTLEFGGIVLVQAGHENAVGYRKGEYEDLSDEFFATFKELEMRGPRVAQIWLANNPDYPDIHMVCTLAQEWVTMPDGSDGVSEYFQSHYENGVIDYPVQTTQKDAWYAPTTPKEVKDSIHYNQVGYNEVGRESARNTLYILGEIEKPDVDITVKFVNWTGYQTVDEVMTSTAASSQTLVVPMVYPCYESKAVGYELSEALTYEYYDLLDSEMCGGTLSDSLGEDTVTVVGRDCYAYRFELVDGEMVSVTNDLYRENALSRYSTSTKTYALSESVILKHDKAWAVEFDSVDSTRYMALSSAKGATEGMFYIFKSASGSGVLAIGEYRGGKYHNYGLKQMDIDVDWTLPHTYSFRNVINADGSNTIHIYVDDVWVGTATNHIVDSVEQGTNDDYLSGKNICFTSIGCGGFALDAGQMTYLEIWEDTNIHTHAYTPAVTPPTCTEQGNTTYTCSCGDSYVSDYVDATGHTYSNGICTACGAADPDYVAVVYGDANGDGTVNGKDLLMLRRYMANYDDETKTSTIKVGIGADANGDGEVNGKDLLMLRRYMANYDDETQSSTIVLGPRS